MKRQHEQQFCQKIVLCAGRQRVCQLWHLAVDTRPALVTLAGELMLHVQNVVVVEVSTHVEAWSAGSSVELNVKEEWVQMETARFSGCIPNYHKRPMWQ
ncbi:hypothetical protein AOLI_G00182410 [Acnodon oligacanthus]